MVPRKAAGRRLQLIARSTATTTAIAGGHLEDPAHRGRPMREAFDLVGEQADWRLTADCCTVRIPERFLTAGTN